MDNFDYKAAYLILATLIRQGPCTTEEIENAVKVGDSTNLDAWPVLNALTNNTVKWDEGSKRWTI